jgi:hypothetical protein
MSNIISKTNLVKKLAVLAFCALLLSFSTAPAGGEGFEIYLNNKVVLQQFGNSMDKIKTVGLEQASPDDQLAIVYYHCGKQGKNRVLIIKDEKENTLKKWNFKDEGARMTCKVKDILGLEKGNRSVLKLYYSSSELPDGRQLASISTGTKGVAKR